MHSNIMQNVPGFDSDSPISIRVITGACEMKAKFATVYSKKSCEFIAIGLLLAANNDNEQNERI